MRLFRHIDELAAANTPCVVALGNFDGLHRGHQVVLGEAGRIARERNVPLAVMVTEPHPVSFFSPERSPFRLTPFRDRACLLEHFGVEILLVLAFDQDLASTSADDFIQNVLRDGFRAEHVVVGYDYRFGAKRQGDTDLLAQEGVKHGFGLTVVEPVTVGIDGFAGDIYSSTLVRDALSSGHPRRAAALLGHWWSITGRVVEGDQRGRTIGFPTANLELGEHLEPKRGVYAVRVRCQEQGKIFDGVANLGARPTFDKRDILLEAHIFDFSESIYGQHIEVELVSFIRPEQKFDGIDSLKAQIALDCETAKTVLQDPENRRERLLPPKLDDYLGRYSDAHPCARLIE